MTKRLKPLGTKRLGMTPAPDGVGFLREGGDGLGKWRVAGHSADVKAKEKWTSYRGALKRQKEGVLGWLVKGKAKLHRKKVDT